MPIPNLIFHGKIGTLDISPELLENLMNDKKDQK